ncbi:MAG: phospholipase D-like domain-containing protein [Idiomarina sp.]|nr:phospholipase D-like domain-containing protein [Idiomarina sp.]
MLRSILPWLLLALALFSAYHVIKPMPAGLNLEGPLRNASHVEFLADRTYIDGEGERYIEQEIFDSVLSMIADARRLVLIDMFLFNDFQGEVAETHRALSWELTEALIAQKRQFPEMEIQVISDPLNSLYGGKPLPQFTQLAAAGIPVTLTDHTSLRDSNPLYSGFWRIFVRPFGNRTADTLANPFGEGRVSARSYLALLNFKANHRKVIIADSGNELGALVTSANPHDGSSAHSNVALRFTGGAAWDLLASEKAVLAFSGGLTPRIDLQPLMQPTASTNSGSAAQPSLQILTERAVERALLNLILQARAGESIDVAAFYLADRNIVNALKQAAERAVVVRVLLDPAKEAFGREKNGVPNRPVAHELDRAGVQVRWCATQGEQCHSKWLQYRDRQGNAAMLLGSSNLTRRNLRNYNLETVVLLRGPLAAETSATQALADGHTWFEEQWYNQDGRQFSTDYTTYADESRWHRILYRFMEFTGLSTF